MYLLMLVGVAYFLVFTAFFLFVSLRSLQSRAWRGVV